MKIQIKNRAATVIFEAEIPDDTEERFRFRAAVEIAVRCRASLRWADLRSADLRSANLSEADLSEASLRSADLRSADLRSADLRWADLRWADLREADLRSANLRWANLSEADLSEADLSEASLREADLREADLRWANLRWANLRSANLRSADLTSVRDDLWAVLSAAPREVPALRQALIDGRVEGSTYSGECACLVGTIANARGVDWLALGALQPNSDRPAEMFFLSINAGDTPATNQHAQIALGWIDEWLAAMRDAFGAREL